jgi:hypothetical protein
MLSLTTNGFRDFGRDLLGPMLPRIRLRIFEQPRSLLRVAFEPKFAFAP